MDILRKNKGCRDFLDSLKTAFFAVFFDYNVAGGAMLLIKQALFAHFLF
ncbi:hypothetical protein SC09_Contig19orf00975 [Bacillus subtilis]|uniref:Uncharacterized protein n=1 Tax=Bacillus subtilis TaxID=1423 RepID=A0A0D1KUL1_BACIU|nr:hypothetical protein SC09_Contig19orf00975 [Bacillus subtilis]